MILKRMILDDDIPAGNWENKYESPNPLARFLTRRFLKIVKQIIIQEEKYIRTITEVGCGEGYVISEIYRAFPSKTVRASDFSADIVEEAKRKFSFLDVYVKSIYDMGPKDGADFILCCEVLEHLEYPEKALKRLNMMTRKFCLLTVPCEPLWRCLNILRGKYLKNFGNTPGHIQHWSYHQFVALIRKYMDVIMAKPVLPWTFVLGKKKQA
jgi:2-polyprenyl-3-methyl-5-hydroxy-6-metoxy-1,4-benzoquinol methylase